MSISDALKGAAVHLAGNARKEMYKCDIRAWSKDKLGIHLWSKQVEIAKALVEHKKVAVKSCHGSGKSYFASVVVAWWVDTRYGTGAVVVSTAPSAEQVSKVLWRYIREHHSKQAGHEDPEKRMIGYTTLQNEWKDDAGQELAWGRKPADTSVSTFQGIHSAGGVLAVLDEANGIVDALWTNVYAITTGSNDAILAIANPDVPTGEFARIFLKDDPDWYKITISAFDTPNFTGEYMPEEAKGGLISPKWVESRRRAWGEDSPRWKSKVLGEFSTDATNNLFSMATLNTGCNAEFSISQDSTPILGCDIARMGEDYTVLYTFQDGVLRFLDKWSKTSLYETSQKIIRHAFNIGAKEVRIDGVGIGAGVWEMVTRGSENRFETVGMIGNAATSDLDKWINVRAEWFDTMRERMFNGEIDIDPEDVDLQDELGNLEYHFKNSRNSLQIESKDDIRKRLGKSPDFADAAMYACATTGIDPTDPVNKFRPGDTFETAPDDFLFAHESQISVF